MTPTTSKRGRKVDCEEPAAKYREEMLAYRPSHLPWDELGKNSRTKWRRRWSDSIEKA